MSDPTLHTLIAGRTYAVTPTAECTITTSGGTVILSAEPGAQAFFVAPEPVIYASDPACLITETFKGASAAVPGGGGNMTIDGTFSPNSGNAQSGAAVKQAIVSVDTYVTDYGVLGESLDLSAYAVNANGRVAPTDEIWFELGDTATQVTWPDTWIWLEGEAPTLSAGTAYRIAVRHESAQRTVANVAYSYEVE